MYRVEVFDQSMNYVSVCYTDDAQTIALDYLAFDPFQITVHQIEAQKGYFCHLTKDNVTVADCIISDVKPGKETTQLSLRPLQALFDAEVFYTPVNDAITWIANNLTACYISSSDTAQLRPLSITSTPGSRAYPLTGYNLNPTINILSVITTAFRTWGVVTEASLDLVNRRILVNIFEQTETKVIECDLENIISSEVTLGDSYGSTNKLVVKKTVSEGTPTGTTEITYYRHNDGTIDTSDTDRIVPVFWDVETLEQGTDMTDAEWIAETATMAKETLSPAQYDNEVVISVWEEDMVVRPKEIALGTITTLHIKGVEYFSILTAVTIEGNVYTLTFGAVRTELTKKLAIQGRSNTSTSVSSGGGGGGAVPIATTTEPGIVMPDGSTITIDTDGTIHAVGGGGGGEGTGDGSIYYYPDRTVSVASNAEILRITSSSITASTVVLECTFDNPSAVSGDVTWTSYDGYISFVGTCTSATTADVTLSGVSSGGEITFTPSGSVTTINNFQARVVDGFIIMAFSFRVSSVTSGTWLTLGTLSISPSARGARQNAVRTANGTYAGMTMFETDGTLRLYPTQTFSNNDVDGAYICKL